MFRCFRAIYNIVSFNNIIIIVTVIVNTIEGAAVVKGNMTEFKVIHRFKALEMLISLINWTFDFKVVFSL